MNASKLDKTHKGLAKKFGVSSTMVWHYRNGEKKPSMDQAIKMSKILGINVQWLMTGEGPKRTPTSEEQNLIEWILSLSESERNALNTLLPADRKPSPPSPEELETQFFIQAYKNLPQDRKEVIKLIIANSNLENAQPCI